MSEQPTENLSVVQPPSHDQEGWEHVARDVHTWHPSLQALARPHLEKRGLTSGPDITSATESAISIEQVETNTSVSSERQEKLGHGIKIVVGGPPHSGKSVFIEALTKNLTKDRTFAFSACPDGEGPWLQRHYDDPEVVRWREKGQFTPEFVERASNIVLEWDGPLMLIDIGGRTSEENAQIVRGATHAIILAGDLSRVAEWRDFFESKGIGVIATLHSHYHGQSDQILNFEGRLNNPSEREKRLTASVHHLERGEPAEERLSIQEVASVIHQLVDNNQAYRETHSGQHDGEHFVVDLPSFLGDLPSEVVEKQLTGGKVVHNRQLQRSALPALYETVDKAFYDKPVWLDGPINSWEAIALACAFDETDNPDIRMRGPEGFIRLQHLPLNDAGDTVDWDVNQVGELEGKPIIMVHAKVSASTRLVRPEEMEIMHIPETPEDAVVIVSTAGPNWLRSSIALGYKDHCSAVAAFQPGEGSTIAWAKDKQKLGLVI